MGIEMSIDALMAYHALRRDAEQLRDAMNNRIRFIPSQLQIYLTQLEKSLTAIDEL